MFRLKTPFLTALCSYYSLLHQSFMTKDWHTLSWRRLMYPILCSVHLIHISFFTEFRMIPCSSWQHNPVRSLLLLSYGAMLYTLMSCLHVLKKNSQLHYPLQYVVINSNFCWMFMIFLANDKFSKLLLSERVENGHTIAK